MSYQQRHPSHGAADAQPSSKAPPPTLPGTTAAAATITPTSPEDIRMDAGSKAMPGNMLHHVMSSPPAVGNHFAATSSQAVSRLDFGAAPGHQGNWTNERLRASPGKQALKTEVDTLKDELREKDSQEQQTLWQQQHDFARVAENAMASCRDTAAVEVAQGEAKVQAAMSSELNQAKTVVTRTQERLNDQARRASIHQTRIEQEANLALERQRAGIISEAEDALNQHRQQWQIDANSRLAQEKEAIIQEQKKVCICNNKT